MPAGLAPLRHPPDDGLPGIIHPGLPEPRGGRGIDRNTTKLHLRSPVCPPISPVPLPRRHPPIAPAPVGLYRIRMIQLPRPPAALILDMDGTLLDTESIYVRSFMIAAADLGRPLPEDFLHGLIGAPGPNFQILVREKLGPDFPYADHRARYLDLRTAMLAEGIPLKPGAVALLDTADANRLPLAVATAATRENAESHLARAGLRHRFPHVITRDDAEHPKPRPDIFLAAAAAVGHAPQTCLAVEDSHNGVRAAHAAGMMTLMVPDLAPPTDEITALCVGVLSDLHAVRDLLLSLAPGNRT